jgi:5-methylcytosine-specific restriction endonuclease McrA
MSKKYKNKEWLIEKYESERLSAYEIAEQTTVAPTTIQTYLEKFDVNIRSQEESTRNRFHGAKYHDEKWLRSKYIEKSLSTIEIAEICDCTSATIRHWLVKHDIEIRSFSEAQENRSQSGENNPAWNGGRPRYYGENWDEMRKKALERDSNQCQICGQTQAEHYEEYDKDIHVHHIKPISTFEEPEDANTLPNLVTLCYTHHREWEGVPVRPERLD